MSRKALESQLVEAQRELELSTFLNKGVLQSNSEFKLRIAELEQENLVLRAAESRLAKTEDKVELAERRLKELQKDVKAKEGQWATALRAEQEAREGLEREVQELREEVRGWREVGERVGGLMARPSSRRGDATISQGRNAAAGPSKHSASRARRDTPTDTTPSAKPVSLSRGSAAKPDPSASSRQLLASPSILPQSGRLQKKRRRIAESADDSDDEEGDEYAPSSPAPARTPINPHHTRTAAQASRATSSTTKGRDFPPASTSVKHQAGRQSDTRRTPPPRTIATVKVEKSSPVAPSEAESEDDPLYLE